MIPGRYPAIRDMAGNFAGCLLYLSFVHRRLSVKLLPLHAAAIALTAVLVYPFFFSIADRAVSTAIFPVLADFETLMGKTRFRGNRSLRMDFTTHIYSTHALSYIPGNWKEYSRLQAALYNPREKPVKLYMRTKDRKHAQSENQQYTDRYNCSFDLPRINNGK